MKKSIAILFSLLATTYAFAQQEKSQLVLSIGTANNIKGTLVQIGGNEGTATPVFNFNVDMGMNQRFSLGLAYCYQQIETGGSYRVTTTTTIPGQAYSNSVTTGSRFTETNQMQHIGMRFLFHSKGGGNGDFYGGLRLGYQIVNNTNTVPKDVQDIIDNQDNEYYYSNNNSGFGVTTTRKNAYINSDNNTNFNNKNKYTQQLLFGYRYNWNESFGIFGEGGLGYPYFMNVGLCVKLN